MVTRLHATVRGHVQGVGFRVFVFNHARDLGLTGWVRNLADGNAVEVVAEGDADRLKRLIEELQRGPVGAHVDRIDESWDQTTQRFQGFEIRAS